MDMRLLVGRSVGEYRIKRLLGGGGMGSVFLGWHRHMNMPYAVKVLLPVHAGNEQFLQRFFYEANLGARLRHEHTIGVHYAGIAEIAKGLPAPVTLPYLAMEYVEGQSVREAMKQAGSRLKSAEAAEVTAQALRGLAAAHEIGLIHRDIKPDNLMIASNGRVKIADFGLARVLGEDGLTQTGQVLGTPSYMSLEQWQGNDDIDARTDLYSLGVCLYSMLSGKTPYSASNPTGILHRMLAGEPTPLSDVGIRVDAQLEAFMLRLMALDRDARFASAQEALATLENWQKATQRDTSNVLAHFATQVTPSGSHTAEPATESTLDLPVAEAAASTPLSQAETRLQPVVVGRDVVDAARGDGMSRQSQWTPSDPNAATLLDVTPVAAKQGSEAATAGEKPTTTPRWWPRIIGISASACVLLAVFGALLWLAGPGEEDGTAANSNDHNKNDGGEEEDELVFRLLEVPEGLVKEHELSIAVFKELSARNRETYADTEVVFEDALAPVSELPEDCLVLFEVVSLTPSEAAELTRYSGRIMVFPHLSQLSPGAAHNLALWQAAPEQGRSLLLAPAARATLEEARAALEHVGELAPPPVVEGFTFLRVEAYSGGDEVHMVPIYRNEAFAKALGLAEGETDITCEFVLLPGGTFLQGSPDDETGRATNEGPQREVSVAPFLLARTPTTQQVWHGLIFGTGLNPDVAAFEGDRRPVERVPWNYATRWCETNLLRLPTESEWEFACRAGTTTPYSFGDDASLLRHYAWYEENSEGRTHEVALKLPNGFGLYDMHGNVSEWVQDTYLPNYEGAPSDGSAHVDEDAHFRVMRMGSWADEARWLRCAERARQFPSHYRPVIGFRAAKSLPE